MYPLQNLAREGLIILVYWCPTCKSSHCIKVITQLHMTFILHASFQQMDMNGAWVW